MMDRVPAAPGLSCSIRSQYDVIVVGAGVAGAFAALLAARRGLQVLLVDRQRFPRSKVCGCCLNRRAQQILQRAGLDAGLRALNPAPADAVQLRHGHRSLQISVPGGLAISRGVLDQWLVDEAVLAGAQFLDDLTATVLPLSSRPAFSGPAGLSDPTLRTVELRNNSLKTLTTASVVLVCDGLGHPSLQRLAGFESVPRNGARLGLGAMFPRGAADDWIPRHQILMSLARQGYAGIVQVENGQLVLAAAVDATALQKSQSPLACLSKILEAAGCPVPEALPSASIRGTIPLTRTSSRLCDHRLMVLGDAAGYVEPFTGEGMAWALSAAALAAPIVAMAVSGGWSTATEKQFLTEFEAAIIREQRLCGLLSKVLRHSALLSLTFAGFRLFPRLGGQLANRISRLPASLDQTQ